MSTTALPVRSTDPDTSQEAAVKATSHAATIRPIVLEIVEAYGPLTHDDVIQHFQARIVMDPSTPRASESGIRTRLSELVRAGLVVESLDDGLSAYGNRARRWVAHSVVASLDASPEEIELIRLEAAILAGLDEDKLDDPAVATIED